jgi:hypothetical protein
LFPGTSYFLSMILLMIILGFKIELCPCHDCRKGRSWCVFARTQGWPIELSSCGQPRTRQPSVSNPKLKWWAFVLLLLNVIVPVIGYSSVPSSSILSYG